MIKIRLDLEALDVQSFVPSSTGSARGTVRGAEGVVGPLTQTQAPECWVESGNCLGTRYDIGCDTSYCISRQCPFDSADCPLESADCLVETADCA